MKYSTIAIVGDEVAILHNMDKNELAKLLRELEKHGVKIEAVREYLCG